ncbi:MAG: DUF6498-containing protein [Burkholderiaceae bacterium]|jgi:hypothetical protein|nr:DUF6498-containing protein [Burkholderiaceae bacterium]
MAAAAGATPLQRGIDAALAVASALVIAWGVLALGWPVFFVMALFWFENVVIGGFNVLRMLLSGLRSGGAGILAALAMAAFFTLHYGMFTAVHGAFVVALFGVPELGRDAMNGGLAAPALRMVESLMADRAGWLAMLAVVAVQAVAFVQWSIATRASPTPLKELMGAPYGRIMVLHVSLIAGAFLLQAFKSPVAGVLLLVALKLAYDLMALGRAPRQQAPSAEPRLLATARRSLR